MKLSEQEQKILERKKTDGEFNYKVFTHVGLEIHLIPDQPEYYNNQNKNDLLHMMVEQCWCCPVIEDVCYETNLKMFKHIGIQ